MTERLVEYSPQDSAEQFIGVLRSIPMPPLSVTLEAAGYIFGKQKPIGATQKIRGYFEPGGLEGVPQEVAVDIEAKVNDLLPKAPVISTSFRNHILRQVNMILYNGPERVIRFGFVETIMEEVGIDPENQRWGIFDPSQAKMVESKAISRQYSVTRSIGPHPPGDTQIMLDWINDYQVTHKEKPPIVL